MHECKECKEKHPEEKICKCGACMYKNCKQIPDPILPLFECIICGKVHFWD